MTQASQIDLKGKVVLITGSSRGIGRATALMLADAGARVVINYSSSPEAAGELAETIGSSRCAVICADIGSPDEVKHLVDETVSLFGRIDVLVNNAAVFEFNPFDGESYETWQSGWQRTFRVNVFGAANAAWLAIAHMRRQGSGKIINVASRAAFRGETTFADYGASKAALVNLTRSIARACGPWNIISSCVAPGFIDTDMARSEIEQNRQEIEAQIPLGRVGTPADVAGAILFLASPLGDYLNGTTIDINGGSWFH